LSYEGVTQTGIDYVIEGISSVVERFNPTITQLTVDWDSFEGGVGVQNYLGIILWDHVKSDRDLMKGDICAFRYSELGLVECLKGAELNISIGLYPGLSAYAQSATRRHNGFLIMTAALNVNELPNNLTTAVLYDPRKVMVHEYFHAYQQSHVIDLAQKPSNEISEYGPIWFIEGSAEYVSVLISGQKYWKPFETIMRFYQRRIDETLVSFPQLSLENIETRDQKRLLSGEPYEIEMMYYWSAWAVAHAINLSSYHSVLYDYWKDLSVYGPTIAWERNIGMTLEEFYDSFAEFWSLDNTTQWFKIAWQINAM
jgi:hypothetical protein